MTNQKNVLQFESGLPVYGAIGAKGTGAAGGSCDNIAVQNKMITALTLVSTKLRT